jgi:CRISPR-associated protein Csx10
MTCYRYLPYTLTLKSPAIITTLGGDPNSSSTLPFIPGSAVRGAVARALGDPGEDTCRQQEFQDLVLGGKVRYLHAYPSADGRRAVPVPVPLRRKKDEPAGGASMNVMDLTSFDGHPVVDKDPGEYWPEEQLVPLGPWFVTIGAAQPVLLYPRMSARIHHQRDRQKGRAWKDAQGNTHGAIFAFESLDAGQSFQGVIQLRGETDQELEQTEKRIRALLGTVILVGRSRRAGYGGTAEIQWESSRGREIVGSGTRALQPAARDISKHEHFRLLLTSACIARHAHTGQIDPAAVVELIEGRLDGRARVVRRRWSFEPIGGFNRKWRLELPQVLAVSAGSVFLLEAVQHIPADDLRAIENEGLGERREEGYGRILFLDAPLASITLRVPQEIPSINTGTGQPPQLVSDIEARIVWAHVARKIEEAAAVFAERAVSPPTNSLIGRLRTPLRGKPEEAIRTLTTWLRSENEAERLKRPAMEQLERCRVKVDSEWKDLAAWIMDAIHGEKVLAWLNADVLAQRCHIVSEESAKGVLKERSLEISGKLIDAVLAALAVRNKTREAADER